MTMDILVHNRMLEALKKPKTEEESKMGTEDIPVQERLYSFFGPDYERRQCG